MQKLNLSPNSIFSIISLLFSLFLSLFPLDLEDKSRQIIKLLPTEQCSPCGQAQSKNIIIPLISFYFSIDDKKRYYQYFQTQITPGLISQKATKKHLPSLWLSKGFAKSYARQD